MTDVLQKQLILLLSFLIIYYLYGVVDLDDGYVTPKIKSYRRMAMMLWSIVAFSSATLGYAVYLFFADIPFFIITLFLALLLTGIMKEIFSLYIDFSYKRHWIWLAVVTVLMFEVIWVIQLFPFTYVTLGFFVTWIWYVLQLLFRFHFSKTGIEWERQRTFLLTNLIIFAIVLFLLNWQ